MKLYFTLFFSAAIVAILGGCNQQPAPATRHTPKYTVDIANKQYSEKAALQVVDAIKLQTTKKSLINQIAKIIKYGDYLFILTQVPQNNILIFKTDGTFLTKITKGRANNEVIYPTDISIDEMNDRLFVLDFYRTFKVFSLDGKYLSHTPLSHPLFNLESVGNQGACLFYCLNMTSKNQFTGYYGKDELTGIYKCPYSAKGYANLAYLSKFHQDSILVAPFFSDTVYLFNMRTAALDPYIIFDFHGKSANQIDRIRECKSLNDYLEPVETEGFYSGPMNLVFINGKLWFGFRKTEDAFNMFDTRTQTLTTYEKLFDELPNYYGKAGQNGELLIYPFKIPRLKEHFEKHPPGTEQGKRIEAMCANEDDNPIIVFAKFS